VATISFTLSFSAHAENLPAVVALTEKLDPRSAPGMTEYRPLTSSFSAQAENLPAALTLTEKLDPRSAPGMTG